MGWSQISRSTEQLVSSKRLFLQMPGVLSMAVMLRKPNGGACEIGLMPGTGLQLYHMTLGQNMSKFISEPGPSRYCVSVLIIQSP